MFKKINVCFADEGEKDPIPAYSDGSKWNGFECPFFTIEQIPAVIAMFNEGQEEGTFAEFVDNTVVVIWDAAYGEAERITPTLLHTEDGYKIKAWPVGAWSWCWFEKV